jgi:type I restriction enzyme S subunit
MIEGLKPYPAYTDTGLPWLGQIPTTWKLRRAKYLFREVDERSKTGSEELLSVSHKTGVTPRSQKNVTMFMAESNVGHKVCRPDDLVINTLWAWMAALGVSRHHGMVSPAYGVYRPIDPSGFRPRFADQLLRTPFYAAEYQRCSTGVNSSRLRLYPEAFFRIPIMLPPKEEQEAIVRFLAHANHKIDGFIRAKRKLIGLLNEQKQAIIHQAVTRGLDPSVPLKPSGIPWLGDIPKHWEVKRAKQVCSRIIDCKNRTPEKVEGGGYTIVRTTNIRKGIFNPRGSYPTDRRNFAIWTERGAPRVGDVFFTREAPAGEACLVPDRPGLCMGQRMMYLRPDPDLIDPEFLLHSIYGPVVRTYLEHAVNGSTVGHLRLGQVGAIPLLLCPVVEQRSIVAHINLESSPLSAAIARTEREIALMQEYRTRLTADLVTGRLDVREAASKLPEISDLVQNSDAAEAVDETELDSDSDPE